MIMNQPVYNQQKKNHVLPLLITIVVLLFVVLAVVLVIIFTKQSKQKDYNEKMDLGDKYLRELDYENAVVAYADAINIDRKQPEGYVSLSQVYVETKDYAAAKEVLAAAPVDEMKESQKQKIEVQITAVDKMIEEKNQEEKPIEEATPTPEEEQDDSAIEDAFYAYVKEVLIPQYGLSNIAPTQGVVSVAGMEEWINLNGIISASVWDFDRDGDKELIIFYYKEPETSYNGVRNYVLHAEVYENVDNQIQMADTCLLSTYPFNEVGSYLGAVNCSLSQHTEDYLYLTWYESDDATRIFVQLNRTVKIFADGSSANCWTLRYQDGNLYTDLDFEQTAGGSSDFEFTGYVFDGNGSTVSETLLYSMENNASGRFPTRDEARRGFFGEYGISLTSQEEYATDNVLENQEKATPIYHSSITLESVGGSGNSVSALCSFNATDWTNLRER